MVAAAAALLVLTAVPAVADGPNSDPTPAPVTSPTVTPSSLPTPTSSATPTALPAPSPKPPATPSPAALRPTPRVAAHPRLIGPGAITSDQLILLSSGTVAVAGFQYTGNVLLPTAGGTVLAMRLVTTSADFSGLHIQVPCRPVGQGLSLQTTMMAPPAMVAHAAATTELLLVELDYRTVDVTVPPPVGGLYQWTPGAPPPATMLAGDSGSLTAVTARVASISTPSLDTAGMATYSSFC